jgi:hypothetical protein
MSSSMRPEPGTKRRAREIKTDNAALEKYLKKFHINL